MWKSFNYVKNTTVCVASGASNQLYRVGGAVLEMTKRKDQIIKEKYFNDTNCSYCSKFLKNGFEMDYLFPIDDGKTANSCNTLKCCVECFHSKNEMSTEDFIESLKIANRLKIGRYINEIGEDNFILESTSSLENVMSIVKLCLVVSQIYHTATTTLNNQNTRPKYIKNTKYQQNKQKIFRVK
jgi:hypothetical protein